MFQEIGKDDDDILEKLKKGKATNENSLFGDACDDVELRYKTIFKIKTLDKN